VRNGSNLPGTNTHFQMPEYQTLAQWEARREVLRKQILSAAGLLPMPEKPALHAEIFGRIEKQGYSVEKVLLETMPGYYLGGNLYRPRGKTGRFPGVVSPHGHWDYGRLENTPTTSVPARCINLARQGYVVFSYDMVGYNDTIQTAHRFGGPREQLWSFGPLGLQLWNSIRAVDFLQSLPDVDPERIAATGASGGGTQTYLLSAVDQRIKAAAVMVMISAIMQGGCACENAPGLRLGASNLEFAAMIAPRPLLMGSATGDWTRNTPKEEFPAVQSVYRLYGQPENVENAHVDAPHNYNAESRAAMYRFFGKHLLHQADAAALQDRSAQPEKPQDLLALHNRRLPENALSYDQLLERWVANARRQNEAASDSAALRERLAIVLGAEWPAKVLSQVEGEKIVLSREGSGERVPGLWFPGSGVPVVVVHPQGADAARATAEAQALIRARRPVLLIDAFQTGAALALRDQSAEHFLVFNKSDDANRVEDILTALAFLKHPKPELIGVGNAAVWCLFAAAVAPTPVALRADLAGFAGEDRDFIDHFFVPGIQRAGGLNAALRLVNRQ
jgi:hypothetical protein